MAKKPRWYDDKMMRPALALLIAALGFASNSAPRSAWAKPPVLQMRELVLRTRAQPKMPAVHKKIRAAFPKGWTGERHPNGRSIEMHGPNGEGRILFAAALHPEGLHPYLSELKRRHPSAVPSPPQHMKVEGVRPEHGDRATRFVVTGREVGEMVMIEKRDAIILVVTIVDPKVWPELQKRMERVYPTIDVINVE